MPRTSTRGPVPHLRVFNGRRTTNSSWSCWTRDDDLWLEEGGCPVYLHARGTSRRGPNFKVSRTLLKRSRMPYLVDQCLYVPGSSGTEAAPNDSEDESSDSAFECSDCSDATVDAQCQLFIPAPEGVSRQDAIRYHLTTRNYLAYQQAKPIIGQRLSSSLLDLWHRIHLWSPSVDKSEYLEYCQQQGYTDFCGHLDNAVAMLALATELQSKTIWLDAFVHCTGMLSHCHTSVEQDCLDVATRNTVARAAMHMNHNIAQTTQALASFLEEELGAENLGLSRAARDHLDRFRSFLQSFYVERAGYWPPGANDPWDKRLWSSMYDDFRCVYEYLADKEPSSGSTSARVLNGGVCIEQNVQAFNERHSFSPLPYCLPLLPDQPTGRRASDTSKTLRSFRLSRVDSSTEVHTLLRQALVAATNASADVVSNSLVKEYIRFEETALLEKITAAEARKIRWMLVYCILQMLISITHAPKGIRETASATYPLCAPLSECPEWVFEADHAPQSEADSRHNLGLTVTPVDADTDRISIHPDCEADNAEDFFAQATLHRSTSDLESVVSPTQRIAAQLVRTASIRSSVSSLHRSVVGSLSRRNSLRRGSLSFTPRRMPSFRNEPVAEDESESEAGSEIGSPIQMQSSSSFAAYRDNGRISQQTLVPSPRPITQTFFDEMEDDDADELVIEATMRSHQGLHSFTPSSEQMADDTDATRYPDVYITDRLDIPAGKRSVPSLSDCETSSGNTSPLEQVQEHFELVVDSSGRKENHRRLSALDFGFNRDSVAEYLSIAEETSHDLDLDDLADDRNLKERRDSQIHQETLRRLNGEPRTMSVNAGTYTPTGPAGPLPARVFHVREISSESITSTASSSSSNYPETSQQAAEIVEEEIRGRRRSRALDVLNRLPGFGRVRGHLNQ